MNGRARLMFAEFPWRSYLLPDPERRSCSELQERASVQQMRFAASKYICRNSFPKSIVFKTDMSKISPFSVQSLEIQQKKGQSFIQGDSLAIGPKQIWEKYSRIWRNAFKCAWMSKETIFSIDYEQVLFCIFPGMCI